MPVEISTPTILSGFSANASKSKQATGRKKMLEKLNFEEIKIHNGFKIKLAEFVS